MYTSDFSSRKDKFQCTFSPWSIRNLYSAKATHNTFRYTQFMSYWTYSMSNDRHLYSSKCVMKTNTIKRSKSKFRLYWNEWSHNDHFKWGTTEKFIDGKHNNIKQILRTVVYIPFNSFSHLESVPVSLAQRRTLNQLDKRRWI